MPIKVLKASAGSGKTHKLTEDYIKLLDESSHNRILAVTFTNKATEEMKSRVIEKLNSLANEKNDEKARDNRDHILHDYSHFNISTIDTFFQKVARSMFRELGLSGLYTLILDNKLLIDESVDQMRKDLDIYENAYNLLLNIAVNELKQGKDWSFSNKLKSLIVLLWCDEYMNLSKEEKDLYTYDNISKFYNECTEQKEEILNEWSILAQKAKNSFTSVGLDLEKDSSSKILVRLDSFIEKKFSAFTPKQSERLSLEGVLTKTNFNKYKDSLTQNGFADDIKNFADSYNNKLEIYYTIDAVVKYANYLPVVVEIKELIKNRLTDRNELLLSDINYLLAGMIGDSDAPFIYEKVGTQINNYLLDEFQDTSSMQWKNFIPLIDDSLARNTKSLVVGDVKQSIYRWRNSDWNILGSEIKKRYGNECNEDTLKYNWRSKKNIVNFNNSFFPKMVHIIETTSESKDSNNQEISKAYSDIRQEIHQDRKHAQGGYVNARIWKKDAQDIDFVTDQLDAIYNDILEVLGKGYSMKDIGILVRYNKYGVEISKYLLEKGINVISSESLLVSSSNDVKLLIHLLKMSVSGNNEVNRLILEKLRTFSQNELDEIIKAYDLPLFEQVERYIQILKLNERKESIVYIQAFQDLVFSYNQKNSSDVNGFLSWWDMKGCTESIDGSSSVDAVNILTIHKSKGLDFPIVIVPRCEWNISFKGDVMWYKNDFNLFNTKLPIVPLVNVKALKDTLFSEEYSKELTDEMIDNLNLLYVAFTRPRNALYIYAAPKGNEHHIYDWLAAGFAGFEESTDWEYKDNDNYLMYSFGELSCKQDDKEQKSEEKVNVCECGYPSVYFRSRNSKVNLNFQTELSSNQLLGNRLHGILQYIKKAEDAPKAVERAVRMGIVSVEEQGDLIEELNEKILKNSQTSSWFDGTYPVIWNERSIISDNIYRPDRIMEKDGEILIVDYKFGEENDSYKYQVKNYMKLLKDMGKWNNVRGCLYYYNRKTIEWVN